MAGSTEPGRAPSRPTPPAPGRLGRPGLGDVRLWAGLVLILASMVVGARLLSAGDDTVTVMRATRDLGVGAVAASLEPVRVSRAVASGQYLVDAPAAGEVMRWPVRAGELVPASAVSPPDAQPSRLVTVAVDPLHAPPGLQDGDVVDVWTTPSASPGDPGGMGSARPPSLVLADVPVAAVTADDSGLTGRMAVVLDVPPREVAVVVAAARGGEVDLVAVPLDSQPLAAPAPRSVP